MPNPLFFVVWGTTVRKRPDDVHVAFCPGCLRIARFQEHSVMKASHVYYIHGEFREVARYSECPVCGTRIHRPPGATLRDPYEAAEIPIEKLIEQDPKFPGQQIQNVWESLRGTTTSEVRRQHVLRSFCTNATQQFAEAEADRGAFATVLLVLSFIGGIWLAVMAAFAAREGVLQFANAAVDANTVGIVTGIAVGVVWLLATLVIYYGRLTRRVACRLLPRLRALFEDPDLEWSQLEHALESGELRFPKLKRHFRQPLYDQFRLGTPRDGDAACSIGIEEYLDTRRRKAAVS
jgi:hypothetical protein